MQKSKHENVMLQEYEAETDCRARETRKYQFHGLDGIIEVGLWDRKGDRAACHTRADHSMSELNDRFAFVKILRGMLTLDQKQRLSPADCLEYPFVTTSHLKEETHSQ